MNYKPEITIEKFCELISTGNYNIVNFRFTSKILSKSEYRVFIFYTYFLFKDLYERCPQIIDEKIGLSFTNCEFEIDTIFSTDFHTGKRYKNIYFQSFTNCTFHRTCIFQNIEFHALPGIELRDFRNSCIFNNIKFKELKFIGVTFRKEWLFNENTAFNGDVYFNGCKFKIFTKFKSAIFNGNLNITSCNFYKSCELYSIILNKDVRIENIVFHDDLYFYSQIHGVAIFKNIIFEKNFIFGPTFLGENLIEFDNLEIKKIAFFRNLRLVANTIFKNIDISRFSFLYSKFEDVSFSSCKFNFGFSFIDEELLNNKTEDISIPINKFNKNFFFVELEDILSTLRIFEINFDKRKNYEIAGEFHKKRYELQRIHESNKFKKIIINLYKWFSNYGEDYPRSLIWIIGILIGFSIIYLFTGIKYDEAVIYWGNTTNNMYKWYEDLGTAFLYSLNSSVPFRREIEHIKAASSLTTFFSIFQTLLQTIIGTLFIVALRRKFRR